MSGWLLLESGPGDSAWNMALDEALLEAMPRLNQPVLRFYGWLQPAASFGYFQHYTRIEQLTDLRPLVRRPTAGGLVPHAADWTYSLAFPTTHSWYALTAVESYRRVHEWVQDSFKQLEVQTELATAQVTSGPGQCFAGYERQDVLLRGQKIAGAAQRRRKDGLLIQGSVQPPVPGPARAAWERAMCAAAESREGVVWTAFTPDSALAARSRELAQNKYSQPHYNRKR